MFAIVPLKNQYKYNPGSLQRGSLVEGWPNAAGKAGELRVMIPSRRSNNTPNIAEQNNVPPSWTRLPESDYELRQKLGAHVRCKTHDSVTTNTVRLLCLRVSII